MSHEPFYIRWIFLAYLFCSPGFDEPQHKTRRLVYLCNILLGGCIINNWSIASICILGYIKYNGITLHLLPDLLLFLHLLALQICILLQKRFLFPWSWIWEPPNPLNLKSWNGGCIFCRDLLHYSFFFFYINRVYADSMCNYSKCLGNYASLFPQYLREAFFF